MLHLLTQQRYRRFFLGFTSGNIAEGLTTVATPFVILALTGDPAVVGLCLAAETTGVLAMAFPGASLADRYPRHRVIASAYALAALALLGVAAAVLTSGPTWAIAAGLFVFGSAIAIYGPASDAMTPLLVDAENLHRGNAMDNLSTRLGQGVLGPLLGGLLTATGLGGWAFLLSAFLCCLAAAIMLLVRPSSTPATTSVTETPEAHNGWLAVARFFRASPILVLLLVWCSADIMLGVGAKPVAATSWATDLTHGAEGVYGLALAAGSIGATVVIIATGTLRLPRRYVQWMIAAWTLGAIVLGAALLVPTAWMFVATYAVSGGLMSMGNVYWSTYLQRAVPGHLLTRVISVDWVASLALTPAGAALAGFAVREWGAYWVLAAIAVLPFVSGVAMFAFLARRPQESPNPAATPQPAH